MQFQVPQFIDIEDKIFGPLTAKQFFYILGGGALIFLMYVFLQLWLVILFGLPVAAFSAALAFFKINGQPFIKIVGNTLTFASSSRLYLWRREKNKKMEGEILKAQQFVSPKLTQSKLQDLAWSLDIQQKLKR